MMETREGKKKAKKGKDEGRNLMKETKGEKKNVGRK